jgi:hypothetical protein
MDPFQQLALAGHCLVATFRELGRPGLWVPWLVLGLCQLAGLLLLAAFAHPAVSAVMAPLVARIAGPDVLHYPNVFRVLPALHARVAFVIDALIGVVAIGAATRLFAARFSDHDLTTAAGIREAARRWGTLVLAHLPLQILVLVLAFGVPEWLHARGSAGMTVRFGLLAGTAGVILVQVVFVLVAPLVMLAGLGVRDTWRELPTLISQAGFAAVAIAVAGTVATWPVQILGRFADRVVDRGTPELVIVLVGIQIVAALVAAFVTAGSITLVYQSLIGDTGDEW